jgi:hypothetical protein
VAGIKQPLAPNNDPSEEFSVDDIDEYDVIMGEAPDGSTAMINGTPGEALISLLVVDVMLAVGFKNVPPAVVEEEECWFCCDGCKGGIEGGRIGIAASRNGGIESAINTCAVCNGNVVKGNVLGTEIGMVGILDDDKDDDGKCELAVVPLPTASTLRRRVIDTIAAADDCADTDV